MTNKALQPQDIVNVQRKEIMPLMKKFEGREIESQSEMGDAVIVLSTLNKRLDAIMEEKERVTKPLNEALKAERGRWKPAETMLEELIDSIRTKITRYQTGSKKLFEEESAKIAARVGEGKGKLRVETAIGKIAAIAGPEASVSTEAGIVKFKTVRKFKVVDIEKLPIKYHLADEVAIRALLKASPEVELAGVEYFDEEQPINFR